MGFYNQKNTKKDNPLNTGWLNQSNFLLLGLIVGLLLSFSTCKKIEDANPPPAVEFVSPKELQSFQLPGELGLHVKIKSNSVIKFVQVTIENYSQVRAFEPILYYPDVAEFEINEKLFYSLLPKGMFAPFFFHIKVIDASGENSYFQEISIINPDLEFKGVYLTTRPSINRTEVYHYDRQMMETLMWKVDGEYLATASSSYEDMYYLITNIPAKLCAFQYGEPEVIWDATPELPSPQFTDIHFYGNQVFAGTANGLIKSFNVTSGLPGVASKILNDSIPMPISAANTYIIGNFASKKASGNALSIFYRSTGNIIHTRPLNSDVVDIYLGKYGYNFLIFGKDTQNSSQFTYHPLSNGITASYTISEGILERTVRLDPDRFLLYMGRKLYRYDSNDNFTKELLGFTEDLVDMSYERINGLLYLVFENRIDVYSYPDLNKQHTINSPYPTKSIELHYSY